MYSKLFEFIPEALIELDFNVFNSCGTKNGVSADNDLVAESLSFRIVSANQAALNLLGAVSVPELKNHVSQLIGHKIYPKCRESVAPVKKGNNEFSQCLEIKNLRGAKKYLLAKCSVLKKQSGHCSVLVCLKDRTSQNRYKQSLVATARNLEENYKGMIDTLSLIMEMKDPYTASHQRKVYRLCSALAQEMKLEQPVRKGLEQAAALHDIGKINIPAAILAKPGRLTDIEYRMIAAHSQTGYNILEKVNFTRPIANIVLQHHERLDGSGYPQGLSGRKIMLEAKILAIADVVEAMSSHRPYRPALGLDKALEEINSKQGRLYDEQASQACLALFRNKGFQF